MKFKKFIKILLMVAFVLLASLVASRLYVSSLYPWEARLGGSGIQIPRDAKLLRKSEQSSMFGSNFSYLFQLPSPLVSCESLGMSDYVGNLAEVMADAKPEFWADLGGEKLGGTLCRRFQERSKGAIVVWAYRDRVILKIII